MVWHWNFLNIKLVEIANDHPHVLFYVSWKKKWSNVSLHISFIYLQHTHTHFSEEPSSQRKNERLHFKYTSRFCSNLMTQDLALYLDLLLQDFILILSKCSHTGTENKTGKCCLSFPLCCYYMSFKCTDCSVPLM